MIGSIHGELTQKGEDFLLVEACGVGYMILTSKTTLSLLPHIGEKVKLHTHLHVREDQLSLFGFATREELQLFQVLITIPGIGPKKAVQILAVPEDKLKTAVLKEHSDSISVTGVGRKVLQKVMRELKEKLTSLPQEEEIKDIPTSRTQAFSALLSLGFSRMEAGQALERIAEPLEELSAQEIVKLALKQIRP